MEMETVTEVDEPPEGMEWWGGGGLEPMCKKEKTTFNPRGGTKKEWLAWYIQKEEEKKSKILQEEKTKVIQKPGLLKHEEKTKMVEKPEVIEQEEKTKVTQMPGLVEHEKKNKMVQKPGMEEQEEVKIIDIKTSEARQLSDVKGELTPVAALKPGQEKESRMRSPNSQTKRSARLLCYQERLSVKFGLPPSRLMEKRRQLEETTPSSTTNPRLMPAQGKGTDLREEFERLGAEARLSTITTPISGQERGQVRSGRRRSGGGEGRRRGLGSLWSKPSPGPGACTDSTYKKVFQLQYRQEVQGEAQSQGGQGVRVGGRGGDVGVVAGPVWGTLAPWCPSCHCWAVMVTV